MAYPVDEEGNARAWAAPIPTSIYDNLWQIAYGHYSGHFVRLVSNRRRHIPDWIYQLFGYKPVSNLPDTDFGCRVSLAILQRMYILRLRHELVQNAVTLQFEGDVTNELESMGETLRKYTQAIRDHEFMAQHWRASNNPFVVTGKRLSDRALLMFAMLKQHKDTGDLRGQKPFAIPVGPFENEANHQDWDRDRLVRRAFWARLGAAAAASAFLVGPMWLLAMRRDLLVHLSTTSACVFLFGYVTTWFVEQAEHVFAATLAYAAVLMVFVGVTMERA